jgi:antitoxin VapB
MGRPPSQPRLKEPVVGYSPSNKAAYSVAKLFLNGRSQAVRLPKEFRFPGHAVSIRRDGDAVILEPLENRSWPKGYFGSWTPSKIRRPKQQPMPPPTSIA